MIYSTSWTVLFSIQFTVARRCMQLLFRFLLSANTFNSPLEANHQQEKLLVQARTCKILHKLVFFFRFRPFPILPIFLNFFFFTFFRSSQAYSPSLQRVDILYRVHDAPSNVRNLPMFCLSHLPTFRVIMSPSEACNFTV